MQKYFWTQEEDSFIINNYTVLGPKKCSELMGKQYRAIQGRSRQLGITRYKHINWTEDKILFMKEYYGLKSAKWISEQLCLPKTAVQKKIEQMGIKKVWKGWYIGEGYKITGKSRTPDRYAEHRKIMEAYLGRKLSPKEIVHHKNGDKLDNKLDNLEIVSRSQHINMHRTVVKRNKQVS